MEYFKQFLLEIFQLYSVSPGFHYLTEKQLEFKQVFSLEYNVNLKNGINCVKLMKYNQNDYISIFKKYIPINYTSYINLYYTNENIATFELFKYDINITNYIATINYNLTKYELLCNLLLDHIHNEYIEYVNLLLKEIDIREELQSCELLIELIKINDQHPAIIDIINILNYFDIKYKNRNYNLLAASIMSKNIKIIKLLLNKREFVNNIYDWGIYEELLKVATNDDGDILKILLHYFKVPVGYIELTKELGLLKLSKILLSNENK